MNKKIAILIIGIILSIGSMVAQTQFVQVCTTGQKLMYTITENRTVIVSAGDYHITIGNFIIRDISGNLKIPPSVTYDGITYAVTSIDNEAFYGCTSLTSITIPNSVTEIGSSAFYGCTSLTSITILNSVTEIGKNAFYGCNDNLTIRIQSSVPPRINSSIDNGQYTIYIPKGSYERYINSWGKNFKYIEIAPEDFAALDNPQTSPDSYIGNFNLTDKAGKAFKLTIGRSNDSKTKYIQGTNIASSWSGACQMECSGNVHYGTWTLDAGEGLLKIVFDEDDCPRINFNGSNESIVLFPILHDGYLYKNATAFNAKNPNLRIKVD